jgi:hypothetical protein
MKKYLFILVTFLLILNIGCTDKTNSDKAKVKSASNIIKTETYYRGFCAWDKDKKNKVPLPQGILIFTNEKDLLNFCEKYMQEINAVLAYLDKVDFNKYYLIYQAGMGARLYYNVSWPFIGYNIKNNELFPIQSNNNNDRVFVTDSGNCIHYYINLNLVDKKYIPITIKNKYSKIQ